MGSNTPARPTTRALNNWWDRGSTIGFFNPIIPTQNFRQSLNPEGYFRYPTSRAFRQSRISLRFCFKIPNPESRASNEANLVSRKSYWGPSRSYWLWLKILFRFRLSRHRAVTLSVWPCLLHLFLSIGTGLKRTFINCCSKTVGDVDPSHGGKELLRSRSNWCNTVEANLPKFSESSTTDLPEHLSGNRGSTKQTLLNPQ